MGLRTTSSKDQQSSPIAPQTSSSVQHRRNSDGLPPNESVVGKMAPALTEPLNATSNLSSSTASASPRPISNNSNSENIQNNNNNNNNNSNSEENASEQANTLKLANPFAFQSVFEKAIAQNSPTSSKTANTFPVNPPNGSNGLSMGPMCDPNAVIDINIANSDHIPVTFVNLISDFEEDIKAEICVPGKKAEEEEDEEELTSHKHMEYQAKSGDESSDHHQQQQYHHHQEEEEEQDDPMDDGQPKRKDGRPKSPIIIQSIQELPRINTDSTVTASEGDNIEENLSQLDATEEPRSPPQQIDQQMDRSPPRTPIQSNLQISQAASISSLTPQSTTSLQKDFIKDSVEMDQVLSDMDLLQVLKNFDTAPSGENLCDLNLFNDVDVMNYEEISVPVRDADTKEITGEIEKTQMLMQRKIDYLTRRLRKLQARHMGKQATEEIAGLFEWTSRIVRRKDDTNRQLSYEDDKRYPVAVTAMRTVVKKVESIAKEQHLSQGKKTKIGRSSNTTGPAISFEKHPPLSTYVPRYDNKVAENMAHVSGLLQTEIKVVEDALDSDATVSSSGGESADEAVPYNNPTQQPLSIARRAAWRYARDRGAIASRWTWLLGQISELEFKIRQQNEQYQQIKKSKGVVSYEKIMADTSTGGGNLSSLSVNGYRGTLPGSINKTNELESSSAEIGLSEDVDDMFGSCRTRPLDTSLYRKRKLIQTANIHTVSKKAARSSSIKCGCQWPSHPCALCTGRSDPTAPRDLPDTMMFAERVALLDPGFHPVLSFPEDVSNSIHIEATARIPEWQNRVIRCTAKSAIKGVIAAQKAAERSNNKKNNTSDSKRKYTKKQQSFDYLTGTDGSGPSTPVLANKTTKTSSKKHHQQRNYDPYNLHPVHSSSIYQPNPTSFSSTKNKIRKISSSTTLNGSQFGGDMNGLHCDNLDGAVNGIVSRSRTSSPTHHYGSSGYHKHERAYEKKPRVLYDIDNIVIPYSVAAATRVEHLPYKEIPTPKWRVIEDDDDDEPTNSTENKSSENSTTIDIQQLFDTVVPSSKDNSSDNNKLLNEKSDDDNKQKPSDNSKVEEKEELKANLNPDTQEAAVHEDVEMTEDITDEAVLSRHERALIEERRKFQTFMKFPWSTRSRANRRIDSRAESSGANTPDPTSPAPNTPSVGGDQESIPSPAAPSTPHPLLEPGEDIMCNPPSISNIFNAMARRNERKRTVSTKKDKDLNRDDMRRSTTPDLRELIPPYEPLRFPLSDDVYEEMLKMMPNDHNIIEDCLKSPLTSSAPDLPTTTEVVVPNTMSAPQSCDEKILNNNIMYTSGGDKYNVVADGAGDGVDGGVVGGDGLTTIGSALTLPTSTTSIEEQFASIDNVIVNLYATDGGANLMGESDTESLESGLPDDDPNDPEWKEEPE